MQIDITDPSQVGDARRRTVAFAEDIGLDETRRGVIAVATTEMATNLVKHAGRGYLLIHRVFERDNFGLRIISVDRGPGIADLAAALTDGHSTTGSMGTGLGSIKRLADTFEIYSASGSGLLVGAEFWRSKRTNSTKESLRLGVVAEPMSGESASGDGWGVRSSPEHVTLMLVDGLGHGAMASEAAREAERIVSLAKDDSLISIISDAHDALKKTRGAALALARIYTSKNLLTFAGVGNISASVVTSAGRRSLTCHNGTVGQKVVRVQEFAYPWSNESLLILHSDGLTARWDLQHYPGLVSKDLSIIAAMLHRDFSRGRDDTTVLAARTGRRE